MKIFQKDPVKGWNLVCVVLLIALLITQFLPFWQYGSQGETVSIAGFVWLLTDHDAVSGYLSEGTGTAITVNDVFAPAVLILIAVITGIFFCLWKKESSWVSMVPLIAGALGFWQYLGKSAYRMGIGWGCHFALCVLLLLLAGWRLCACCIEYAREKQVDAAH